MPIVKKDNRVLTVEESSVSTYLKQGYDQVELNEKGDDYVIVKRATGGKKVSYSEYVTLLEENETLKEQLTDADNNGEVDKLKAENKALKAEITKLKKADA